MSANLSLDLLTTSLTYIGRPTLARVSKRWKEAQTKANAMILKACLVNPSGTSLRAVHAEVIELCRLAEIDTAPLRESPAGLLLVFANKTDDFARNVWIALGKVQELTPGMGSARAPERLGLAEHITNVQAVRRGYRTRHWHWTHPQWLALTCLDLSHRALTEVPPELALIPNLTELDLSSNDLTIIPEALLHRSDLRINVADNRFQDIPLSVCSERVQSLDFSNNPLRPLNLESHRSAKKRALLIHALFSLALGPLCLYLGLPLASTLGFLALPVLLHAGLALRDLQLVKRYMAPYLLGGRHCAAAQGARPVSWSEYLTSLPAIQSGLLLLTVATSILSVIPPLRRAGSLALRCVSLSSAVSNCFEDAPQETVLRRIGKCMKVASVLLGLVGLSTGAPLLIALSVATDMLPQLLYAVSAAQEIRRGLCGTLEQGGKVCRLVVSLGALLVDALLYTALQKHAVEWLFAVSVCNTVVTWSGVSSAFSARGPGDVSKAFRSSAHGILAVLNFYHSLSVIREPKSLRMFDPVVLIGRAIVTPSLS